MHRILLFLILSLSPIITQAGVITWQLDNVVFDDGNTVTGYFDYNSDIERYVNFNLTVTAGSGFSDFTYFNNNSWDGITSSFFADFVRHDVISYIHLEFDSDLTNERGSRKLLNSFECDNCENYRYIVQGRVFTARSIPEPTSIALLVIAVVLFGFKRTKCQLA